MATIKKKISSSKKNSIVLASILALAISFCIVISPGAVADAAPNGNFFYVVASGAYSGTVNEGGTMNINLQKSASTQTITFTGAVTDIYLPNLPMNVWTASGSNPSWGILASVSTYIVTIPANATGSLTVTVSAEGNSSRKLIINITVGPFTIPSDYFVFVDDAKIDLANPNSIIITPDIASRRGAMWAVQKINLGNPFSVEMDVYLGHELGISGGVGDGVAFVLQNDQRGTKSISNNGAGLGIYDSKGVNYIKNAFAIEFDTYYNGDTIWDSTDPALPSGYYSHASFVFPKGSRILPTDHLNTRFFNSGQFWQKLKVQWTPQWQGNVLSGTLSYDFNSGQCVASYLINNVNSVFGTTSVYWGMTGATGVACSLQKVRFETLPNY